jgi:hypothetical protein
MDTLGLIGDASPTELPQTQVDDNALNEEKLKSKFSRTKEFKEQKEWVESRIKFYQKCLPDGRVVGEGKTPTGEDWLIANAVIAEFQGFLDRYEYANQVVHESQQ